MLAIKQSKKILHRYLFNEIFVLFSGTLFVFTGTLVLIRILRLAELVISKNVPFTEMVLLFSYVIPGFLEIALPMAVLLGVILAFGRLSADSELIVMRACGISLGTLARPLIEFSTITFFFTLVMSVYVRPWANNQLGEGLFEIAKVKASSGLTQGVFNDFGNLTIYAEKIKDHGERLQNVIIADRRDKNLKRTFIATRGQLLSEDSNRSLIMRLYDGSIHEGKGLSYNVTYFQNNNIFLSENDLLGDESAREGKKTKEMYIGELLSKIKRLKTNPREANKNELARLSLELHSRFAIPVACFFVAFIAMALGIQPNRGGKSWNTTVNIITGILVIVAYYLFFGLTKAIGQQASTASGIVLWIPNLIFCALAFYLFIRVRNEKWLQLSEIIEGAYDLVKRLIARVSKNNEV